MREKCGDVGVKGGRWRGICGEVGIGRLRIGAVA